MALQNELDPKDRSLVMYGLGVSGDVLPNLMQPKLVDGVHMRWAFTPERGFPFTGFTSSGDHTGKAPRPH